MEIRVKQDSVEIEGYVNAIERNSKPLMSRIGQFIERICKGAFKKAIKRNDDVHILLNHDWNRDLGSTKQGNLELEEDNIGLHARATISDPDVVRKARNGELVGWSFGFQDRDVENSIERGLPLREVKDLDLYEVSLLDRSKKPAYDGTLVCARSKNGEEQIHYRGEDFIDEVNIHKGGDENEADENVSTEEDTDKSVEVNEERSEEQSPVENTVDNAVENPVEKNSTIDYSKYRNMIKEMKED